MHLLRYTVDNAYANLVMSFRIKQLSVVECSITAGCNTAYHLHLLQHEKDKNITIYRSQ